MKKIKNIILKNVAEQIKKTAQIAVGTTSYWGMYQPEETENIKKVVINKNECTLFKRMFNKSNTTIRF